jgi:hypothetical protein
VAAAVRGVVVASTADDRAPLCVTAASSLDTIVCAAAAGDGWESEEEDVVEGGAPIQHPLKRLS